MFLIFIGLTYNYAYVGIVCGTIRWAGHWEKWLFGNIKSSQRTLEVVVIDRLIVYSKRAFLIFQLAPSFLPSKFNYRLAFQILDMEAPFVWPDLELFLAGRWLAFGGGIEGTNEVPCNEMELSFENLENFFERPVFCEVKTLDDALPRFPFLGRASAGHATINENPEAAFDIFSMLVCAKIVHASVLIG